MFARVMKVVEGVVVVVVVVAVEVFVLACYENLKTIISFAMTA